MRHLIVCCDGTWNTPQQESTTNVARLHNALAEHAEDGSAQLRYYHPGVGTAGGLLDRLLGGAAGLGLSRNVCSAYHWLATTYEPGDRIALFGFSRGAYTVRSVAGIIAACGLIDPTDLDEETTWRQIAHVYDRGYRPGRNADLIWREGLTFRYDPAATEGIPVHFIGVWDTVGALGIPDTLGVRNLLDSPRHHEFHDVKLNPYIRHARHAVAADEFRGPLTPALWTEIPPEQDVKQVWFPGNHLDVGGGHRETGLSDCSLQWMIDQARETVGLGFHKTTVNQIQPNPLDVGHDDNRSVFGWLAIEPFRTPFFQPRPRPVPLIDPGAPDPTLDRSLYERHQNPPITAGPYRPTRVLALGESATVSVFAREPWNETGLYLEAGHYTFTAEGEWLDAGIRSGPEGTTGLSRFHPREAVRLLFALNGQVEKLLRWVTRNAAVSLFLSRREDDLPWMSLVGVVANDAKGTDRHKAHERIGIGAGAGHDVHQAGYLYAFANDAWGYYGNNRGSVRLTVTRM